MATFQPTILPIYDISVFPLFPPFRCGCDECVISRLDDSLRHSRSRINAYRALASPSLISLSSKDPILTAFELSWELRRLSFLEHEFKVSQLGEISSDAVVFATRFLWNGTEQNKHPYFIIELVYKDKDYFTFTFHSNLKKKKNGRMNIRSYEGNVKILPQHYWTIRERPTNWK